MLRITLSFLLVFPLFAFCQLSPEVDSIFESLNSEDLAENSISASSLVVLDNKFRSLASIATDQELMHVALHGSPALKECAMGDLVERKSAHLDELFSKYLASSEQYKTIQAGKVVETAPAVQLFKRISWQKEKRQRKEYYERTTNSKELVELKILFGRDFSTNWSLIEADSVLTNMMNSALIFENISSENLSAILKINDYKCENYTRLKHFAHKYRSPEVIAALGNFKNNTDLPFFTMNFDNAFAAISRFPHPSLFNKLRNKVGANFDNPLYQDAVASYKTTESKLILEEIHRKIKSEFLPGDLRDEKLLSLYNIIEKKDCKIYQSVLNRINVY